MEINYHNLDLLISHMRMLRPDQFDIRWIFRDANGRGADGMPNMTLCGTAACFVGECAILAGETQGSYFHAGDAREWLGISEDLSDELFTPNDYINGKDLYSLPRAIDVLCHLRDKGEVRWDLFPAENYIGEPWSPPHATEIREPELPEALTRLLGSPADVVTVE